MPEVSRVAGDEHPGGGPEAVAVVGEGERRAPEVVGHPRSDEFVDAEPYVFVECIQSIFPIEGIATPVSPGTVIDYKVPDMYGRPWAQIWDEYFEGEMQGAGDDEDIFSFE